MFVFFTISRCLITVSFLASIYCLANQTHFSKKGRSGELHIPWSRVQLTWLFPFFLRKWGWLARLVSILGTLLVAISLLPLSPVFQFAFCDSTYLCIVLYSHLRLTDSHSRPRKSANLSTNAMRACFLGGSKYFKGGPNATVKFGPGVQLLRGSKSIPASLVLAVQFRPGSV